MFFNDIGVDVQRKLKWDIAHNFVVELLKYSEFLGVSMVISKLSIKNNKTNEKYSPQM